MSDRGGVTQDVLLRIRAQNQATADFRAITAAVDDLTGALDKQTAAAARGEVKEKELIATSAKLGKAIAELKSIATLTETFKNFDKVLEGAQSSVDAVRDRLTKLQTEAQKAGADQGAFAARIQKTTEQLAKQEANLAKQQQTYRNLGDALRKAGVDTDDLNGAIARMGAVFDRAQAGATQLANATLNYTTNLKAQTAEAEKAAAAQRSLAGATTAATAAQKAAAEAHGRGMSGAMGASMQGRNDALREQRENAERTARLQADNIAQAEKVAETARAKRIQEIRDENDASLRAYNERRDAVKRTAEEEDNARRENAERTARLQADNIAQAEKVGEAARARRIREIAAENESSLRAYNERRDQAIAAEKAVAQARVTAAQRSSQSQRDARAEVDKTIEAHRRGADSAKKQADETVRLRTGTPEGGRRTDALGRAGRGEGQAIGAFGLRPYELTNLGYQVNDIVSGFIQGQNAAQIFAQQGPQVVQIFGTAILRWLPLVGAAAAAAAVSFGALSRAMREVSSNREFEGAIRANANAISYNSEVLTRQRKEIKDMGVSWQEAGKVVRQAVEGNVAQGRVTQIAQLAQDLADINGLDFLDTSKRIIEGLDGTEAGLFRVIDAFHLLTPEQRKHVQELIAAGKQQEAMGYTLDRMSERMRDAANNGIDPLTRNIRSLSKAWDDLLLTIGKTEAFQNVSTFIDNDIKSLTGFIDVIDRAMRGVTSWTTVVKYARDWATGDLPVATAPIPPLGTTTAAPNSVAAGGSAGLSSGQRGANEKAVRDFLVARGYSPNAIAAIMGNISLESGFNPAATNATGHFGLVQWDKNRQAALGGSTDINKQMELLDKEIGERIPTLKKSNESVEDLTIKFEKAVEVSGGQGNAKRVTEAQRYAAGTGEVTTAPPDTQKTAAEQRLRTAREERSIAEASSREARRQAEYAKIEREENEKGGEAATVAANIAEQKRKVDQKLLQEELEKKDQDRRLEIDNARHLNEIQEAGRKAREAAAAAGVTGYEALEAAERRGQQAEADRLQRLDAEQERLAAFRRQLAQLNRGQDAKNATELAKALAAVEDQYLAVYDAHKKLTEQATDSTKAQVEAMKPLIEASKERAKAEATLDSYRKQASSAERTRATLEQTYNKLAEDGVISIGEAQQKIKEGYEATSKSITEAADELERLIATDKNLSPERVAEYTAEVKRLRAEVQYVDPYLKGLRKTFVDSIADNASKAFDTVAEAIGGVIAKTKTWADVWTSMKTAAANFFAGVLKDIATYIIKAQLAKALSALMPGLGLGGLFGGAAATAGGAAATAGGAAAAAPVAAVLHDGGVVGNDNVPSRRVPAHWFASAPRYHTGTVVGLAPNERTAILQTGEEVLTADNPRHAKNWVGGGAAPDINIRNVLVADPNLVPSHMGSAKGERVIMNVLTRNAATVRQLVR